MPEVPGTVNGHVGSNRPAAVPPHPGPLPTGEREKGSVGAYAFFSFGSPSASCSQMPQVWSRSMLIAL